MSTAVRYWNHCTLFVWENIKPLKRIDYSKYYRECTNRDHRNRYEFVIRITHILAGRVMKKKKNVKK